jgi:hypothetical protein
MPIYYGDNDQYPEDPSMNVSQTPNFSSILDEAPTEVNRPKPPPEGTYLCIVGQWEQGKSAKKGTPFVKFPLRVIAADEDVDPDALAEMGGFEGRVLPITFYTTEDAVYRLDEFHQHCGVDLTDPASRRMRNDLIINAQVYAYVKHRQADPNDPNSTIFAEIARTAPAE